MKKLLLILAIGAFTACGGETTEETTTEETGTDTSTMVAPATTDTSTMMGTDTAGRMGTDTATVR